MARIRNHITDISYPAIKVVNSDIQNLPNLLYLITQRVMQWILWAKSSQFKSSYNHWNFPSLVNVEHGPVKGNRYMLGCKNWETFPDYVFIIFLNTSQRTEVIWLMASEYLGVGCFGSIRSNKGSLLYHQREKQLI